MSAISNSNSNQGAEFAFNKGQGCSLLCSPLGVLLLEHYSKNLANNGDEAIAVSAQVDWFPALKRKVEKFLRDNLNGQVWKESDLTKGLYKIFKEFYPYGVYKEAECKGTGDVYDWVTDNRTKRSVQADIAFGNNPVSGDPCEKESNAVIAILEASLDNNGGNQKLTQAADYAAVIVGNGSAPTGSPGVAGAVAVAGTGTADVVTDAGTVSESRNKYLIVWTLHLNCDKNNKKRQKDGQQTKTIVDIKVDVYLCEVSWNSKHTCPQSRYALIWREETIPSSDPSRVIADGSSSIARATAMVAKLAGLLAEVSSESTNTNTNTVTSTSTSSISQKFGSTWQLKGPNCVKVGAPTSQSSNDNDKPNEFFMLKIFDNRFNPTPRSPFLWLQDCVSRDLAVEPYLLLHEKFVVSDVSDDAEQGNAKFVYTIGDGDDKAQVARETIQQLSDSCSEPEAEEASAKRFPLGKPWDLLKNRNTKILVPFPRGTVVILRYKYVEGLHWPERVPPDNTLGSPRSFLPVLKQLESIHDAGCAHGDIRLFNMIFEPSKSGEECRGHLLDFDFGGLEKQRRYPPGYKPDLPDILGARAGSGQRPLSSCWDLADLIGVILLFPVESMVYEKLTARAKKQSELKSAAEKLKTKRTEVENRGLRIQLLEKEKQESKIEEQEYRKEMGQLNDDISRLKGDIEALEAKMSVLKGELNASCSERQSCEEDDTLSTSDKEIDDLDGEIEKLESEIEELKGVAERAKTFAQKWDAELTSLRAKLTDVASFKSKDESVKYHGELRDLLERPREVLNLGMDPILYFPNNLTKNKLLAQIFEQVGTTLVATGTPERTRGGKPRDGRSSTTTQQN